MFVADCIFLLFIDGEGWFIRQLSVGQRSSTYGWHKQVMWDIITNQQCCFQCLSAGLIQACICICSTPYTPLDKRAMDNTDEDTVTEDWTVDQPLAQTRTTAIVEVKGAVNVVLTPLVVEALDRSDITSAPTSVNQMCLKNQLVTSK